MILKISTFLRKRTVAVGIVIIAILFFLPVIFQGKVLLPANFLVSFYTPWAAAKFPGWDQGIPYKAVGSDDLRIFYPQRMFTQDVLRSGQLPFWNPYSFSGNYHIGLSETAVFYPLFFLFSVLPQSLSWLMLQIIQPVIGFIGMYLFLKFFLEKKYAFFGGVVFAFSGILLVRMVEGLSVGHTLIWIPFAFLGVEGFLREKQLKFLIILTSALCFSVLAGWFQFAFYLFAYSLLFTFFRIAGVGSKKVGWNLLVFAPFILAPLLTLFHIWPALNTLLISPRESVALIDLAKHLLPLSHIFTLFYPDYWGNPATLNFFGQSEYKEAIVFIGVIPTLLAVFSLGNIRQHKIIVFFIVTAVIAFLLGTDNIIANSFLGLHLPIVSSFLPDRTMYIVSFALCALSAFGFKAFFEDKKWRNRANMGILIIIVALLVILSHRLLLQYLPVPSQIKVIFAYLIEPINAYFDGRPGISLRPLYASIHANNVIIGDGLIVLFAIIFLFKKYLKNKVVYSLLLGLTLCGQLYFAYKYIPFSYPQFIYPTNEVFSYLQQNAGLSRYISAGSGYIQSNMPLPYKVFSPDGVSSMYPLRYGEFVSYSLNKGNPGQVARIEARIDPPSGELLRGDNPFMERFMQVDGVKYIVVLKKDIPEKIDPVFKPVWKNKDWQIFRFIDASERVYWTNTYEVLSQSAILSRLFSPKLPASTVILEKEISLQKTPNSTGSAKIVSYTPNRIVIQTKAKKEGLVYLSDNYTSQFKARVDSEATEILRANYSFRAIKVPAGSHTITLEYRDDGFNKGVVVSFLTLGLTFLGTRFLKRKKVFS